MKKSVSSVTSTPRRPFSLPELCTFHCSSVFAPRPPQGHRKRDEMESVGCTGGASVGGWSHGGVESSQSRVEL